MGDVVIGPLVFPAARFAVLVGIAVYLLASGVVARRLGDGFRFWSTLALVAGLVAARAGFVALNWDAYAADPLGILAFWQGGFSWQAGLAGGTAVAVAQLVRAPRQVPALLLAAAFAAGAWNVAYQLTAAPAGVEAPREVFRTLAGDPVSLADRQGRPLVVNLWASWCPPCRREMPMMAEVAAGLDGVDMVFANQGEAADAITGYLDAEGLSLPAVVTDPAHALMAHYGVRGLPTTLFIRADGSLQSAHSGEISRAQLLSEIERLRQSPE